MDTSAQWQLDRDAAQRYERILVASILGPAARALVEWAELRAGEAVIDVGCGTGAAARLSAALVGPPGRVVGVDVNKEMIAVARSLPPVEGAPIEWFVRGAYHLPFADQEFDVALCGQTLQFLDDRPRALAEMQRVLRPRGRLVLSLWCDIAESPYFHALAQAVSRRIGPKTAVGLVTAFSLSDADSIRALLTRAGFRHVKATIAELELDLPKPGEFVPLHISATPMSAGFQAASEELRQAVVDEVSSELKRYETAKGLRVPFRTHLLSATR